MVDRILSSTSARVVPVSVSDSFQHYSSTMLGEALPRIAVLPARCCVLPLSDQDVEGACQKPWELSMAVYAMGLDVTLSSM
jgi:hypothetical protein